MESTSADAMKLGPVPDLKEHNYSTNVDDTDENYMLCSTAEEYKEETENENTHKPLDDHIEKVAYNTGLFKSIFIKSMSTILNDIDSNNRYFQLSDRINIFQCLAKLYTKKDYPTCETIYMLFKKNLTGISFSQFQYMMSCLGFEYRKTESGIDILIEDPSLTFKRFIYLNSIRKMRAKSAPIFYIDERLFDSTFTFSKPQICNDKNVSPTPSDGYVFFHAVSKQGFLNGLFCSPATKTDFIKWVSHILIPLLPGPSVIIMNNNDLHGSLNTITKYHSKNDMINYLQQRNIPCSEKLHKADLYELITRCSVKHTSYDVDEILKVHGHFVLRLPPNFEDLSITHFLWEYFRKSEPNLFLNVNLSQVKIVLLERLSHLTQELWNNFHKELVAAEQEILKTDLIAYKALETNYKISY